MIALPREAAAAAMARFAPLPRAERQARTSLWTMYYFAALIIPAVTTGLRTGRVPATGIDALLCTADADGHVVEFRPTSSVCSLDEADAGFDALVRDHLAVVIEGCACGLPAGVAWSNAAVMIDHALSEARLTGPHDIPALRAAEALIADDGRHPQLARLQDRSQARAPRLLPARPPAGRPALPRHLPARMTGGGALPAQAACRSFSRSALGSEASHASSPPGSGSTLPNSSTPCAGMSET